MEQSAVLHFNLVARMSLLLARMGDVADGALAGFGRHHLIDGFSCSIGKTYDVAALLEQQGVAAVVALGDTRGGESVVGGHA